MQKNQAQFLTIRWDVIKKRWVVYIKIHDFSTKQGCVLNSCLIHYTKLQVVSEASAVIASFLIMSLPYKYILADLVYIKEIRF